ncbi:unnamed protein product [Prorocentrum cordatum]|uniref:GOLD domain-containing protein n=1 Tax=Prorocentrum cordatum TaxID=2364126 RepID=A0ABN9VQV1_9DINO|nr:unnamed protein product [Polarella glacialis]
MPATARAAAAAALAPLLLAWRCQALFFELKPGLPGNGECFKFNADLGHRIFVGNYEADGPEEGIVVRMLDPDMVQLFEHKTPSGKLKHTEAKAGIYQLCFLSTIPEVQMVSFDSRFGLDDEFADDHHLFITQNHTDKVKETAEQGQAGQGEGGQASGGPAPALEDSCASDQEELGRPPGSERPLAGEAGWMEEPLSPATAEPQKAKWADCLEADWDLELVFEAFNGKFNPVLGAGGGGEVVDLTIDDQAELGSAHFGPSSEEGAGVIIEGGQDEEDQVSEVGCEVTGSGGGEPGPTKTEVQATSSATGGSSQFLGVLPEGGSPSGETKKGRRQRKYKKLDFDEAGDENSGHQAGDEFEAELRALLKPRLGTPLSEDLHEQLETMIACVKKVLANHPAKALDIKTYFLDQAVASLAGGALSSYEPGLGSEDVAS